MSNEHITLQSFSQRITAWPDGDWSGISDPKVRRRLQNRLNQRVRRLEKKMLARASASDTNHTHHSAASHHATGLETSKNDEKRISRTSQTDVRILLAEIEYVHILELKSVTAQRTMQRLGAVACHQYMLGSPRTEMLPHLIQFNFVRALMENMGILGLTSEGLHDDAISPFNVAGPWKYDFVATLPPGLQPTPIQRAVPHHPWLDLLPIPEMRDNLISAGESYDECHLCLDMRGCTFVGTGQQGIIVWKDPWDPAGWEVTEAFAHSWGWVLQGCWDLFRSTNSWRAQRHEPPVFRFPRPTEI